MIPRMLGILLRRDRGAVLLGLAVVVALAWTYLLLGAGTDMETMDMGTDHEEAHSSGNGMYLAHVQFSMSGPWAVQVAISSPGTPTAIAMFEVSAQ